ncbi:MAG: hypothetical protein KJO50_00585 [Bacteroidia bacterium]|nr:hypothetical protein [Bacteroidia bacterium]
MKYLFTIALIMSLNPLNSQDINPENDYYHQIPDYPVEYNEFTVAARMIDGLGHRYYWASKDLREEDLEFRPTDDSRSTNETLTHIYGLSRTVLYTVLNKEITRSNDHDSWDYETKRIKTLENIKQASEAIKDYENLDMENMKITFRRGENTSSYPFWNLLNGPLADAMWHTGQVVSHRRSSGNPFDSTVSLFSGKKRE